MRTWMTFVLRHKLLVVVAWLVIAGAGAVTAPATVDSLSYDFSLPGQPAYETNTEIVERFGGGAVGAAAIDAGVAAQCVEGLLEWDEHVPSLSAPS